MGTFTLTADVDSSRGYPKMLAFEDSNLSWSNIRAATQCEGNTDGSTWSRSDKPMVYPAVSARKNSNRQFSTSAMIFRFLVDCGVSHNCNETDCMHLNKNVVSFDTSSTSNNKITLSNVRSLPAGINISDNKSLYYQARLRIVTENGEQTDFYEDITSFDDLMNFTSDFVLDGSFSADFSSTVFYLSTSFLDKLKTAVNATTLDSHEHVAVYLEIIPKELADGTTPVVPASGDFYGADVTSASMQLKTTVDNEYMNLTESSKTVDHNGGNSALTMSTNVAWTVSHFTDWAYIQPSFDYYAVNSSPQLNVDPNTGLNQRSRTFTFTSQGTMGSELTDSFVVTQIGAPSYFTYSESTVTFRKTGQLLSPAQKITSNEAWTLISKPYWVNISPTTSSQPSQRTETTLTMSAGYWGGTYNRTGIVTFKAEGSGQTYSFNVSQIYSY